MLKNALIALLGLPIMILGLVAWILPFIPGAPLFFLGLGMLIGWHPAGAKFTAELKEKLKRRLTRWGLYYRSAKTIQKDLFRPEEAKLPFHSACSNKND